MQCKICQGENLKQFSGSSLKADYYICRECEFIFIDENKICSPSEEKSRYEAHDNSQSNKGYVNWLNSFLQEAVLPFKNGSQKNTGTLTALDFGSGPEPVLAALLEEEGFCTTIFDPYFSPDQSYKEKTYDLITSTEVLEHLLDPMPVLRQLSDLLNPDGLLAVMTNFHPGEGETFNNWWYVQDFTHISFYNLKTFQQIEKLLPLEIVYRNDRNICVFKKKTA